MSIEVKLNEKVDNRLEYISQKAKTELDNDINRKVIVLVPDQFNFACQKLMLDKMNTNVISQIEVLSFNRLVYRIYEEANYFKEDLSNIERLAIISNIVEDKKDELKFFGKHKITEKIIIEINNLMKLIVKNVINLDDLKNFFDKDDEILTSKIMDVANIYEEFSKRLVQMKVDINIITPLKDAINNCSMIDNASIYVSEFYNFTNEQLEILKILENANAKITLILQSTRNDYKIQNGLFAPIKNILDRMHISESNIEYINMNDKDDKMQLIKDAFVNPTLKFNIPNITINKYSSKEREIFNVCIFIKELIKKGYRYNDISIVIKKIDNYELRVKDYFDALKIPYFMENRKALVNSKIVRNIYKMFEMNTNGFNNQKVLTFIKENNFNDIDDHDIFCFENFVLETGIEYFDTLCKNFNSLLKKKDEKKYSKEKLDSIGNVINFVKEIKNKFELCNDNKSVDFYYEMIIEFLTKKINPLYIDLESKETEKIINVLDKWKKAEIKTFNADEYIRKLKILLEDVSVTRLNETLDQINIYDSQRVNLLETKILIMCGFNDVSSDKSKLTNLFTDKESDKLYRSNIEFNKNFRNQILEEKFLVYNLIEKVSDNLMINYTEFEDDNKVDISNDLLPLRLALDGDNEICFDDDYIIDNLLETDEAIVKYAYLNINEFEIKKKEFSKCLSKIKNKEIFEELLNYKKDLQINIEDKQDMIELSFSALKQYVTCPFSYFMHYKLGIKERNENKYDAAKVGNIAHELFEKFFNKIANNELNLAELDEKNIIENADYILENEVVEEYLKDDKNETSYNRYKEVLYKNIINLVEQLKHGKFNVQRNELEFGKDKEVTGIEFLAEDGTKIYLGGKIDRYDAMIDGDKVYLKVIDYKTGNIKFDKDEILEGKNMQLVIYLKVLMDMYRKQGKDPQVAGIFYAKINKELKSEEGKNDDKEFKYNLSSNKLIGAVSNEEKIISMLDDNYKNSDIISIKFNKNGEVQKNSNSYSQNDFEDLTQKCYDKTCEISNNIVLGKMDVTPNYPKREECKYCPYSAICGLDLKFDK